MPRKPNRPTTARYALVYASARRPESYPAPVSPNGRFMNLGYRWQSASGSSFDLNNLQNSDTDSQLPHGSMDM